MTLSLGMDFIGMGAFTPSGNTFDSVVSTAKAGYSTRKLRSAYAGSALRVKRSSDNTEQDIGFSGGELDTTALLAFVGAGNGFAVKWYDQIGSNDLVATSSAPFIVTSGSTNTTNGKAALNFDNSTTKWYSNTVSNVLASATLYSVSAVAMINVAAGAPANARILSFAKTGDANDFTSNQSMLALYRDASNSNIAHERLNGAGALKKAFVDTQMFYAVAYQDATNINLLFDNVAATPAASAPVALAASLKMGVGASGADQASPWVGSMGEIIIWDITLTAPQLSLLYSNTKAYWGTP